MDELTRIVQTKHRLGADPLRDQQLFRHDYAMHDAALLAARAFVFESFATVQDALEAGDDPTPVQRQRLRQATTYATRVATDAVRFAYTAAGTDALRPGALQRCFRDLHAATQHLVVDNNTLTETTRRRCSGWTPDVRDLEGKVAVVTGAASGIGRSLAGRLAVEGMHVVLADVEEVALRDAVAGIGGDAVAFTTDVTSMAAVEALAEFAYDTFGAVHVLCNNAGVFQGGLMWECSDADFEWTLGVNLWGIVHGVRAFVPRMLAAGTEGHVVNTVSMAGLATTPFSGPYDVSKFAAMAATECLAHDLASVGRADQGVGGVPGPGRHRDQPLAPQPSRRARRAADRRRARSWSRRWPTAPPGACRRRRSPTWWWRRSARSASSCPPARATRAARRPHRGPRREAAAADPDVRLIAPPPRLRRVADCARDAGSDGSRSRGWRAGSPASRCRAGSRGARPRTGTPSGSASAHARRERLEVGVVEDRHAHVREQDVVHVQRHRAGRAGWGCPGRRSARPACPTRASTPRCRGGTRRTTRARRPCRRSPGRSPIGCVVRPVAAADEHRVAGLRRHALRGGGVGELPAVHRCAGVDVLGAAQARDVVEHAARDDAVAPEVDGAACASVGMPYWSSCWPFQVSSPSATGRWQSASRWVSVKPWMNSDRWSHIAPESCIATMWRAGYGLAGPGLVSIDRAHEIDAAVLHELRRRRGARRR